MSDRRLISEEYTEIGNELIQMMPELKVSGWLYHQ